MIRLLAIFAFIALSVSVYPFTGANGLVIKQRFDHNGGTSGYYLGDQAIFGGIIYNQMSKGGYAKFISDMGSFVICDYASRDLFYTYGKSVKRYKGTLDNPYSMEVTPNGDVYVGDIGRDEIQHLSFSGSSLVFQGSVSVNNPLDVYYYRDNQGGAGEIYAVSGRDVRVYRYDVGLGPVNAYSGVNYFNTRNIPRAVCADYFFIYVLNSDSIDWYAKEGGWIKSTPLEPGADPVDFDRDVYGNFYILDRKGYIHKYFNDSYVCTLLNPGTGDYSLNNPNGISIDKPTGLVCVFDDTGLKAYNISVGVFGFRTLTGAFVSGPSNISNLIEYSLSGQAFLSMDIRDSLGRLIRSFYNNSFMHPGSHQICWDGRDYTGSPVNPGRYRILIKAQAEYSAFNSDVQFLDIDVRDHPTTRITYLSTNVICSNKSFSFIGFTNSEPMDMVLTLADLDSSRIIGRQKGVPGGFFVYDHKVSPLPDGEYQAELFAQNALGLTCSAQTNIIVNYTPLQFRIVAHSAFISPQLSRASIGLWISENAVVTAVMPDDTVVTNHKMKSGTNEIVWSGRDETGSVLPDGLYPFRIRAFQGTVENQETNIVIRVDSTPPVITASLDHEYISPVDSPGVQDSVLQSCAVNETSELTVRVYDASLNPVALPFQGAVDPNHTRQIPWNGMDQAGNPVPDGHYQIEFRAVDLAGNVSLQSRTVTVDNNNENEGNRYQFVMSKIGSLSGGEYNIYYSRPHGKFVWFDVPTSSLVFISDNLANTNSVLLRRDWWTINNMIVSPDEKFFAEFEFSKSSVNNVFNSMIRVIDIGMESSLIDYSISLSTFNYIYPVFPNGYMPSDRMGAHFPKTGQIRWLDSMSGLHDYVIPSEFLSVNNMSFISYSPDNRYLVWSAPTPFNKTVIYDTLDQTVRQLTYLKNIVWISTREIYALFPDATGEEKLLTRLNIATGETNLESDIGVASARLADISYDKKKVLISDGTDIYLYNDDQLLRIGYFDYINQVVNNVDVRNYSIYFSIDGNSVIVAGIKNGERGIYKIGLNAREPYNLEAKIDYPSVGIQSIGGLVKISGSAGDRNFDHYSLDWKKTGDGDWNDIVNKTIQVNQDILGVLDASSIPDGSNITIRLSAYDRAGNSRFAVTTNKVVNNAGYLLSGVSVDRDYVPASGAHIRFLLNEVADATVKLRDRNGLETTAYHATVQSGWVNVNIAPFLSNLTDGKVVFTVSATASGKTMVVNGEFVLDRIQPSQGFYSPDDMITSMPDFIVTGYVNDANLDYYRIVVNSIVTNTKYQTPIYTLDMIVLDREGTNTIELYSVDKAGNSRTDTLHIILDTVPPVCRIDQPVNGGLYGRTLAVQGFISDAMLVKFDLFLNDDLVHTGTSVFNGSLPLNTAGYQGPARLVAKAYDAAGNMTVVNRDIYINNVPPQTTVYVNTAPFSNAVFSGNGTNYLNDRAVFNFVAASPVQGLSVTNTVLSVDHGAYGSSSGSLHFESGFHQVSYYSVDALGNTETAQNIDFRIDDDLPDANLVVSEPCYDNGTNIYIPWNNRIRIQASDGMSGIKSVFYSVDDGASWSPFYEGGQGGLLLTLPGLNTVRYYAVDNVGNVSSNKITEFILDPVPPYTAVVFNGTHYINGEMAYYTGSLDVQFQAVDDSSGVSNTAFRTNMGDWLTGAGPVQAAGQMTLEFYSLDRVGNAEVIRTLSLRPDSDPPQSHLVVNGLTYTNSSETVYALAGNSYAIEALDSISGLAETWVSINAREWKPATNSFGLDQETNMVEYYSMDNLSNTSVTQRHQFLADDAPPESEIIFSNGMVLQAGGRTFCQPGVIVSVQADDRSSGVKSAVLKINGVEAVSNAWTVSQGTNRLEYHATDNLGNIEDEKTMTVISPLPDTTPPLCVHTFQGVTCLSGGQLFGNSNTVIVITAEDPLNENGYASGISGIYYHVNGVAGYRNSNHVELTFNPGNSVIDYFCLDNMEQSSPTNRASIRIDVDPPITTSDYSNTAWTNDSVLIRFAALDRPAGFSSGVLVTMVDDGSGYVPAQSVTLQNEGVGAVRFYSQDCVSNRESVQLAQVRIDRTPPVVYASGFDNSAVYTGSGVMITSGASDLYSGLSYFGMDLRRNGISVFILQTNLDPIPQYDIPAFTVSNHGSYSLVIEARDAAGNMIVQGYSFEIDAVPPAVPENLRHLFDGRIVYLEWDPVREDGPVTYRVSVNGQPFWDVNFPWLLDFPPEHSTRQYAVSAVDGAGNESAKTPNISVVISDALSFVHPSTNVYFRDRVWIRASYDRRADDDGTAEWEKKKAAELDDPGHDTNTIIQNILDLIQTVDQDNGKGPSWLTGVTLEYALSNSLVPVDFRDLYEIKSMKNSFVRVPKLDDWEEGNYALLLKGLERKSRTLEDAVWFGVDQTPPLTFLVIDGKVLIPDRKKTVVRVREGSKLRLKMTDPVVNGSSSGIGETLYLFVSNRQESGWKKYQDEEWRLAPGKYTLKFRSSDRSRLLFQDSRMGNRESEQVLELVVGNTGEPDTGSGSVGDVMPPDLAVTGVSDYAVIGKQTPLSWSATDNSGKAPEISARLDGKAVSSPVIPGKPGVHRLRIEARDLSGNIAVRDIVFTVKP